MPMRSRKRLFCVDHLRHSEYYDMTGTFDDLYARSAKGEVFTDLMGLIVSRENILLAYRNIKANDGSYTPGTDNLTIKDIANLSADEVVDKVRKILTGNKHGYFPKPVRRKEVKKEGSNKTRPLGIPCIWDRLIQQCILQVIEPILEAKFSNNSFGFRPNRSVENAIAEFTYRINICHLYYVIEIDIQAFFDTVCHSKLIKQLWTLGIRDTALLSRIRSILVAPILLENGETMIPTMGTPQGGILSPILANVALNEFDQWIDSQWENHLVTQNYKPLFNSNGTPNKSNAYRAMKGTNLKEMHIVRYADDIRILCRSRRDAERTKIAAEKWLNERLRLTVSPEKTKIVNVKRRFADFLGLKFKLRKNGEKLGVISHVADKKIVSKRRALVRQISFIAKPRPGRGQLQELKLYNSMVVGMQNYYSMATAVASDFSKIAYIANQVMYNRLGSQRGTGFSKTGRKLTEFERKRYGDSKQLKYLGKSKEPIYPIGYVRFRAPKNFNKKINSYTEEGRQLIHQNLRINTKLMKALMRKPVRGESIEYADNRISLFSAQWGKCAITGREFLSTCEIHCHHIIPRSKGGSDKYSNLVLVLDVVHRLIHATAPETIQLYKKLCGLTRKQLNKVNEMREKAGLPAI